MIVKLQLSSKIILHRTLLAYLFWNLSFILEQLNLMNVFFAMLNSFIDRNNFLNNCLEVLTDSLYVLSVMFKVQIYFFHSFLLVSCNFNAFLKKLLVIKFFWSIFQQIIYSGKDILTDNLLL
jgi:hypothetical protein